MQRSGLLTGPAQIGLTALANPDGAAYQIVADMKLDGHEAALRLASNATPWNSITPEKQTGIDAAVTILTTASFKANALVRQLERLIAPHEAAAYEQALEDALDVTEGIEEHGTCGCGEPMVFWEGSWHHVYNDQLRGTDDHEPTP